MKDRIISLLKHGIPPTAVAKAVGCSDSYVSQLMADEGIRLEVTEARIGDVEESVVTDQRVNRIERLALQNLEDLVPFVKRPSELLRIFEVMNGAKKKTSELTGLNTNPTAALVQITISAEAAVALRLSSDNQVIEVGGRSMATLPTQQLNKQLKERREAVPRITDSQTAEQLLVQIEQGIPADSLAHVL